MSVADVTTTSVSGGVLLRGAILVLWFIDYLTAGKKQYRTASLAGFVAGVSVLLINQAQGPFEVSVELLMSGCAVLIYAKKGKHPALSFAGAMMCSQAIGASSGTLVLVGIAYFGIRFFIAGLDGLRSGSLPNFKRSGPAQPVRIGGLAGFVFEKLIHRGYIDTVYLGVIIYVYARYNKFTIS